MPKINLKKLTMSFATAAVVPTQSQPQPAINAAALVSQKIAQMKEAQAPGTALVTEPVPAVQAKPVVAKTLVAKTLVAKKAPTLVQVKPEVVKTPVAKKVLAPTVKKDRDLNTLLSNNFRTFQVVGTTQFKGSQKIWFANETATKIKNMEKQGHTDSNFIHLPKPMTKEQALAYLAENPTLLPQFLVSEKQERLTAALKPRN